MSVSLGLRNDFAEPSHSHVSFLVHHCIVQPLCKLEHPLQSISLVGRACQSVFHILKGSSNTGFVRLRLDRADLSLAQGALQNAATVTPTQNVSVYRGYNFLHISHSFISKLWVHCPCCVRARALSRGSFRNLLFPMNAPFRSTLYKAQCSLELSFLCPALTLHLSSHHEPQPYQSNK